MKQNLEDLVTIKLTVEVEEIIRRLKISPYSACFCGSGKKYKFCCKEASKIDALSAKQIQGIASGIYNLSEDKCFFDILGGCSNDIIRSHSIQRTGALESIITKENNNYFVYGFSALNYVPFKELEPEKVNWKKASTFRCICGNHDRDIFKPIDNTFFTGVPEQVFLASLRSLLLIYDNSIKTNRAKISLQEHLLKGRALEEQVLWFKRLECEKLVKEHSLNKDIRPLLDIHKNLLNSYSDYDMNNQFNYINIYLKGKPELFSAGRHNPEYSINGKKIQNGLDSETIYESFSISSLTTQDGVAFSLCWNKDFDSINEFFMDFITIDKDKIPNFIVELMFKSTEGCFFSIDWWNGLTDGARYFIKRCINELVDEVTIDYFQSTEKLSNLIVKNIEIKID